MEFLFKEKYDIDDLKQIVKILRSPNGCPWDREQDHHSIRQDFIEEVYEVIEAIDNEDTELLKEELGDTLLQVVFHSTIEEENGRFNLSDVADGICKKLIVRHPHVFGDTKADTTDQVLKNWDDIKMQTKSQTLPSEAMQSVSKALPALMRSDKIRSKAKKVGFCTENFDEAYCIVQQKLQMLSEEQKCGNDCDKALGELLFAVVNLSYHLDINPEESLYHACDDFTERFKNVEFLASQKGLDINKISKADFEEMFNSSNS